MSVSCAVVIPIYRKPTPTERLSLAVVEYVLARYQRYILMPEHLDFEPATSGVIRMPSHHFASINSYGALMVDPNFYELFSVYEYILIYQLDCLVFSDRLAEFCSMGYDYVAPVINGRTDGIWPSEDVVGVGGFSLRNVQAHLRVLKKLMLPESIEHVETLKDRIRNNGAEDMFWSFSAQRIDDHFTVAPTHVAMMFGFEGNPVLTSRKTAGQQPFGAHHWTSLSYYLRYLHWIKVPNKSNVRLRLAVLSELVLANASVQLGRAKHWMQRTQAGSSVARGLSSE